MSCSPAISSFPAGSRVLRAHVVQGEQEGPVGDRGVGGCCGLDPGDPPSGLDSGEPPKVSPPCPFPCDRPPASEGAPQRATGASELRPASPEAKVAMQSGDPEAVATLVNKQSKVSPEDLSLLLDLLPSENLRWTGNSRQTSKSFQAGSFVHGGIRGVRASTRKFPEATKAICAYVRQIFPAFTFGTVGLFRDVCAVPHRDSNNEAATDNAIAALSAFKGGGIWMQDPQGDVAMDFKGRETGLADIPSPESAPLAGWP